MTPTLNAAMDHREEPRWRRRALRSRRTRPWRKGAWDRGGPRAAGRGKVSLHVAHRLWPLGVWSQEQGVTQWSPLSAPALPAEPSASGAFRSRRGPVFNFNQITNSVVQGHLRGRSTVQQKRLYFTSRSYRIDSSTACRVALCRTLG